MRVQGTGAAAEIAVAIRELATPNDTWQPLDLIVVARGGGSIEDLWEFNEEIVARTIVERGRADRFRDRSRDRFHDLLISSPTCARRLRAPRRN